MGAPGLAFGTRESIYPPRTSNGYGSAALHIIPASLAYILQPHRRFAHVPILFAGWVRYGLAPCAPGCAGSGWGSADYHGGFGGNCGGAYFPAGSWHLEGRAHP